MNEAHRWDLKKHQRELDEKGFTIVPDVLKEAELEYLRTRLDEIYAAYDPEAHGRKKLEGFNLASNVVDQDPFFETLFLRSPVYDLMQRLLGEDCILSSLNSLEPLKGGKGQGFHRDGVHMPPEGPIVANSLWAIDGMDQDNGATRVIPGSHKDEPDKEYPNREVVHAKVDAGGVLVTNAHIVHAASTNHSGRRRRVVHGFFTKRGLQQQVNQKERLTSKVQARLSPLARRVLALDD